MIGVEALSCRVSPHIFSTIKKCGEMTSSKSFLGRECAVDKKKIDMNGERSWPVRSGFFFSADVYSIQKEFASNPPRHALVETRKKKVGIGTKLQYAAFLLTATTLGLDEDPQNCSGKKGDAFRTGCGRKQLSRSQRA